MSHSLSRVELSTGEDLHNERTKIENYYLLLKLKLKLLIKTAPLNYFKTKCDLRRAHTSLKLFERAMMCNLIVTGTT